MAHMAWQSFRERKDIREKWVIRSGDFTFNSTRNMPSSFCSWQFSQLKKFDQTNSKFGQQLSLLGLFVWPFSPPREMRHRHRLVSSFKCQFFLGRSRPPLGLRTFFPSKEGKLGEKKAPSKTLQSACSLRKKNKATFCEFVKNGCFFPESELQVFFF